MRLSRAIELFAKDLQGAGKSPLTVTAYVSDLSRLRGLAARDSVLDFTPELVRRYLALLVDEEKAPATLHRRQAAINVFAKWGIRHQLWTANPMDRFERAARPESMPRPFTEDEVAQLRALELPPMESLLRALLFLTGLRVTPICGIKVGDISFDPPSIRALVKGNKVQVVPLHPELKTMLYDYVLGRTDLKGHTPLLARKGRPLRRRGIERITAAWGEQAGVPACTPHRFRHSFATTLLRAGVDIYTIKDALGHRDINSTMIYTKIAGTAVAEGIARLPW